MISGGSAANREGAPVPDCPGASVPPSSSGASIEHLVSEYDSQREGMALVAGWKVQAQVMGVTGRRFVPVLIAVCPDKADAEEIAALLNAKYGGDDASA